MATYKQIAKKKFTPTAKLYNKSIDWIMGDGRYALVANCQNFTIKLYDTSEDALEAREGLNVLGCGSNCIKEHFVVDLDK